MGFNIRNTFGALALCGFLVSTAFITSGCAKIDKDSVEHSEADPIEPVNRGIFKFNQVVDGVALKPAAQVYRGVVPEEAREGVSNAFSNLKSPVSFVNSVAQGNTEQAFTVLWRFILNTTFGVGGIFDFAGHHGLKASHEDFGQTLGRYGSGPGPYLVLPLIGPSNVRDGVGFVADMFSDPTTYALDRTEGAILAGGKVLSARSDNYEIIEDLEKNSLDPYATFRSVYLQRREKEIETRK